MSSPIIDIHTHCSPRLAGDPFGVADLMRGVPVGKNAVTNSLRPFVVSYHDMYDLSPVSSSSKARMAAAPSAAPVPVAACEDLRSRPISGVRGLRLRAAVRK